MEKLVTHATVVVQTANNDLQFDSLTSPSLDKIKKKGGIAAWANAKTSVQSFHRQLCAMTPSIRGHGLTVDIASSIPRQQNGYDCGAFVLAYLSAIARVQDVEVPTLSKEVKASMRDLSKTMRINCLTAITDNIRRRNWDRNDRNGGSRTVEVGEGVSGQSGGYVVEV